MRRQKFLEEFLKLYRVEKVEYTKVEDEKIIGIAIYDTNNSEEKQEFCWHMSEEKLPSESTLKLIQIINENGWCDIDKITVSKKELFQKLKWNNEKLFNEAFAELFDVEINMLDNGEETDSFFVHI